jgi:precorrin-6B C5,15-methyltransferase / cobalt-precorrin-6B C5,C15-methyltransferase
MITLIGMGEDGLNGLPATTQHLIAQAEILIGSERLLAMVPGTQTRHAWPSPFSALVDVIKSSAPARVVILATGDPLHFGVGNQLALAFTNALKIIPHPSAFSLAAARLGWPLQEVECLSLHGRAPASLEPFVQPCQRILALTAGDATIREVASRLTTRGYGISELTVLEHMGGPLEKSVSFTAQAIPETQFSALSTLAIECLPAPGARLAPRVPGLPDDAFIHDGQLTKREVRAVTLAALGPVPGALLWDVGAGCGSVAIEWMRINIRNRAIAFEQDEQRLKMIAENASNLGTPALTIIPGKLPATLHNQPRPDAVFLGGAVSDDTIFRTSWEALHPGGRMVANSVTLEGDAANIARHAEFGGDLVRIDISHVEPVGRLRGMRPRMSVLQWRAVKPW